MATILYVVPDLSLCRDSRKSATSRSTSPRVSGRYAWTSNVMLSSLRNVACKGVGILAKPGPVKRVASDNPHASGKQNAEGDGFDYQHSESQSRFAAGIVPVHDCDSMCLSEKGRQPRPSQRFVAFKRTALAVGFSHHNDFFH